MASSALAAMNKEARYTARVGDSHCVAENVTYDELLARIVERTVRGAVSRSIDESEWEDEELRRRGLAALAIHRDGKAVWADPKIFEAELDAARSKHIEARFKKNNELDPALYDRIDRDLRTRWRLAGYDVPSLRNDMKKLFVQVEKDADSRASGVRAELIDELVRGTKVDP